MRALKRLSGSCATNIPAPCNAKLNNNGMGNRCDRADLRNRAAWPVQCACLICLLAGSNASHGKRLGCRDFGVFYPWRPVTLSLTAFNLQLRVSSSHGQSLGGPAVFLFLPSTHIVRLVARWRKDGCKCHDRDRHQIQPGGNLNR